ncbi:MAG: HlyD family efflux transporter periplasmic adaptor subunit [Candidatus Marinimicrobia bacterium]|nr:HlyD family efflux transporter periplasmic adaptor subunit [Candidatus Neomarinimicrobiota bacterium]
MKTIHNQPKQITSTILAGFFLLTITGCSKNDRISDAYGNFEAVEITVSAEANGKILQFDAEEGQTLEAGAVVGMIDPSDLEIRKAQLLAQRDAGESKISTIQSQIEVQLQQQENLSIEKTRIENLLKDNAAAPKQMDDIVANIRLIAKQIKSTKTQVNSAQKEIAVIDRQIDQVDENIQKCRIVNPIRGTVLNRFAEAGEITAYGKPLYNIADLSTMDLRVYVSGAQLSHIAVGQKVDVLIDKDKKTNQNLTGTIGWISPSAEFTPKTIQTKEERVNLVYAVKVKVKNDGSLKIGMPGEMIFLSNIK